jgi:hypothetical protein
MRSKGKRKVVIKTSEKIRAFALKGIKRET